MSNTGVAGRRVQRVQLVMRDKILTFKFYKFHEFFLNFEALFINFQ